MEGGASGLRDIVGAVGSKFGYDISPVGGAFETIVKLGNSALKAMDETQELGCSDVRNAVDAVGAWLALPSRQAWIPGHIFTTWSRTRSSQPT